MSGPSEKVTAALLKCDAILEELDEPYAVFVFEEQGASISNGFCCLTHMKQNVVGLLTQQEEGTTH